MGNSKKSGRCLRGFAIQDNVCKANIDLAFGFVGFCGFFVGRGKGGDGGIFFCLLVFYFLYQFASFIILRFPSEYFNLCLLSPSQSFVHAEQPHFCLLVSLLMHIFLQ